MNLVDEIRNLFAGADKNKGIMLENINVKYPAWVVKRENWYGIAIPNKYNKKINERFSNVKIKNLNLIIGKEEKELLLLTSNIDYLRNEFATICAEFVELGENGEQREKLMKDPIKWWDSWKTLLGNAIQNKKPYSVLGEMLILLYLVKNEKKPKWAAVEKATHDIEIKDYSYEVKSTTKRYESVITISSQNQMIKPQKDLYLCFCRFEKSKNGYSIEDIAKKLEKFGYSYYKANLGIEKMGFEKGMSVRDEKYKIHEIRKYKVDNNFPKITKESFVSGKLPDGIVKITYDIDLNGLKYETIGLDL
jgi:hypothetical protein